MYRFDVIVIGTGPAGQRAAIQAAKLGRSVAAIERRQVLGGVCVNGGTIPSKTLREAVLDLSGYRRQARATELAERAGWGVLATVRYWVPRDAPVGVPRPADRPPPRSLRSTHPRPSRTWRGSG